ncbi:hypothetical protein DPMN_090075 [Dreissena polymorpha]|uniref:Uncharacterized protein n=1 Tax=Dreissena polymorpha TaxID=45954 RepID=A0A9D4KY34_DREPO|nr:hypothetical protein DPMN_090075 [Dreissena polymorpha]
MVALIKPGPDVLDCYPTATRPYTITSRLLFDHTRTHVTKTKLTCKTSCFSLIIFLEWDE